MTTDHQTRKKYLADAANADHECPMLGMFINDDKVNIYIQGEVLAIAEMIANMMVSEPVIAAATFINLAQYHGSADLASAAIEALAATERAMRAEKLKNQG